MRITSHIHPRTDDNPPLSFSLSLSLWRSVGAIGLPTGGAFIPLAASHLHADRLPHAPHLRLLLLSLLHTTTVHQHPADNQKPDRIAVSAVYVHDRHFGKMTDVQTVSEAKQPLNRRSAHPHTVVLRQAHVQQMSPPGGAVAMAELQPPPPPLFEQQRQGAEQQQQSQAVDDFELDFGSHSDAEDQTGMQQGQSATGSALASAKLSSKKKEALSQVPCKFFRSNGCSAGNACPFAHTMPGEGQGKAVCQWFLKGNCRFGHRCALAHVLPGQPMSVCCRINFYVCLLLTYPIP